MSHIPYAKRNKLELIDEWSKCYLNYQFLKLFLNIMKDCNREKIFMEEQAKIENHKVQQMKNRFRKMETEMARNKKSMTGNTDTNQAIIGVVLENLVRSGKDELMELRKKEFKQIAEIVNTQFVEHYSKEIQLYSSFVQQKFDQIESNFSNSRLFYYSAKSRNYEELQDQFRVYLQFLYVESRFLLRMVRSNTEAEIRILEKHKLYAYNMFPTPQPLNQKFVILEKYSLLNRQIQTFYIETNQKQINSSRNRIQKIAKEVQFNKHIESLIIGFLSGILLTIIIFMVIILERSYVRLQINPLFNFHFPLWRGISTVIFYVWMLGINLLFFETYKISHRIILENDYIDYPKSNDLFKIASVFSVVFIVLFVIYALVSARLFLTQFTGVEWLPLGVWGLFFLFLVAPLPIYISGRLYCFRMLWGVIKSIVGEFNFLVEFACIQLFALITVFQDSVYLFCFYINYPGQPQADQCKSISSIAKFGFTIFLYLLRIWHSLRILFVKRENPLYKDLNFLNIIKYLMTMITAVLSFVTSVSTNNSILPTWIVFATISTIYSFIWDWKVAMDLFKPKSKNFMLRDELVFPKINYYCWIVLSFLLRITWTLYISPAISKELLGSPEIFSLTFGYLVIIRRGIWNIVRVELEQVRNRQVFRAIPKQKEKTEEKIRDFLQKYSGGESVQSIILEENIVNTGKKIDRGKMKIIIQTASNLFNEQLTVKIQTQAYKKQVKQKINELCQKVYD